MARVALTDITVKRMKTPAKGQRDIIDKGYTGLALRVSYGGGKSWIFFFRLSGRLHRMTLGKYPAMSLREARDAWRVARELVAEGKDPRRSSLRADANSFEAVFRDWLKRDQAGYKSMPMVRQRIEKDVLPYWGDRTITDIVRRDVLEVIDRVLDRGTIILARRLQSHLHRLFRWAVSRDIIDRNPVSDLPKPGSERHRDRVLTDAELVTVWRAAEAEGFPYGPAVQLLVLSGARREEITKLKWSEIHGDEIVLEGARTKTGTPHHIPLSPLALKIISKLPRFMSGEYLFGAEKPPAGWSQARNRIDRIAKIEPRWTIHDLRRTFATGLQRLGTPLQVTEACLGHTSGSRAGIIGVYQRHDYAPEKRQAVEAWGGRVAALVE
jgi:integrase